jgi:phosphoglycolate phosphatase
MPGYSALIFDLDGTLIDSAPDIAAAINACFAERGWPELPVAYVESFLGNGPRRLVADIVADKGISAGEDEITSLLAAYIAAYGERPAERTRFFPHVREDLAELRQAGFRLGICTNKPHALTGRILEILGLAPLFDAVLGADAVPACKPDPGHLLAVAERMGLAPGSFAYIGDTPVDRNTARSAGVPFFVVPWGGGPEVDVPAQARLARLSDLLAYRPDPAVTPA